MNQAPFTIDLTYFYSITDGDKAFEQLLLTGTVAEVSDTITALEKSWSDKNIDGIKRNAHSLVSLAAIAGMPQVQGWSRKINEAFRDGIFHPELALLVQDIVNSWPSAQVQLNEVIANN